MYHPANSRTARPVQRLPSKPHGSDENKRNAQVAKTTTTGPTPPWRTHDGRTSPTPVLAYPMAAALAQSNATTVVLNHKRQDQPTANVTAEVRGSAHVNTRRAQRCGKHEQMSHTRLGKRDEGALRLINYVLSILQMCSVCLIIGIQY